MSRTLYDILEVARTAPPEVIKSAYRSLAAIYHPDSGQSPDEDKFKRIVRAYEVLSDPEKRSEYDARILHEEEDKFLGFATDDESLAPKTVKRVDGTDTWCTIDEHIRRKGAELTEADLNGLKLRDLSLKKAQLQGADLSNADIKNVDLSLSNLESVTCKNSIFENVDFARANMDHAYFEKCRFKTCEFSGTPWQKSPIKHASFISSDISNHSFYYLSFHDVDFSNSILENATFCITKDHFPSEYHTIKNCKMINVNLRMAEFGSNITNVDFSNSNLDNINCSSIRLVQCNFNNTNLSNSKFKQSIIKDSISFENSVLYNADFSSSGITNSDLSSCNLINTRFHEAYLVDVIFPVDYNLPNSAKINSSLKSHGGPKNREKDSKQDKSKPPITWGLIVSLGVIGIYLLIFTISLVINENIENEWYLESVRLQEQENWTQMVNHAEEWTKNEPDSASAWFYLGYALGKEGNYQEAVNAYRNSLELDSFCAATWNNLGVKLGALEKVESAREAYLEALNIEPEHELAQENLERLQ